MDKEKLILKLNMKDYNNSLEKILSKKNFSEDSKNLLLSMVYSIENAYNDYKIVKVNVPNKNDILQKILDIVEKDCNSIKIIEPTQEKQVNIDREKGKITTYLNVKKILYLLYMIRNFKLNISNKYNLINKPIYELILQGKAIYNSEIIRDFDGWAWNINIRDIENIDYNFLFQIMGILIGNETFDEIIEENFPDILSERLANEYNLELSNKILDVILQITILVYLEKHSEDIQEFHNKKDEIKLIHSEMENKETYLDNLLNNKRELNDKIVLIDKLINNDKALKKEFIKRNEKLDFNDRIFSISDFVEVLEKEKEGINFQVKEIIKKMKPINYLKVKDELEAKINLLNALDDNNKEELKLSLIKLTLKALKVKISLIESKTNIMNLIYILRYMKNIYVSNVEQIKNIQELKQNFEQVEKLLITKACEMKVLNIISQKIDVNYKLIRKILQTDIINFQKIYIKFEKNNENIILKIYDEINNFQDIEYKAIEELNIKFNKKIKLFLV